MGCSRRTRVFIAFWLMGLLNNSGYVIMNSLAKDILPSVVGLVYFVNIFPTLLIKGTGPYWYHLVSYKTRVSICTVCMIASYLVVALSHSVSLQLLGIAIGSITGGLGEPTILSYTSRFPSKDAITAWSSGTGFAGVFGYGWTIMFTRGLGMTKVAALLVANVLPAAYFVLFGVLQTMAEATPTREDVIQLDPLEISDAAAEARSNRERFAETFVSGGEHEPLVMDVSGENHESQSSVDESNECVDEERIQMPHGFKERTRFVLSLWPFTIPLFIVYASEYMLQAGTWSAIGFPITSADSRHSFYVYANWCYQVGVFISRSSGMCFPINKTVLWLMPLLQFGFLLFFAANSAIHFWWDYSVLLAVFIVGLLGGAVYVCAFVSISQHFAKQNRPILELALSSASFADTLGILLANVMSVWIQHCLYTMNGISDNDAVNLSYTNTTQDFGACFK